MIKLKFFLIALLLVLLTQTINAQKVGLVLSGGGAKGISHIGVIKALEENGIPIDYVTGTSMGALIGGLYAIGYSPEEMQEIVTSEEFQNWAVGSTDNSLELYYKKLPADASWVTVKFRKDSIWRPVFPTGLVSTELMDFVFLEFFSPANAVCKENFDSLFVPYRCVGADIANNKPVIFKQGDLAKSIRGSISFPFYFEPSKVDGKIILDGGMYNNFPVDVMYNEFFPDVIIGSKAAGNYDPPKQDDIASQIATIMMSTTNYDIPCGTGVIITPELEKVGLTDFSKAQQFIDSGYVAAKRHIDEIKLYVNERDVKKEAIEKDRKLFRAKEPELLIDKFYIQGLEHNQFHYVNRILRKKRISTFKDKPIHLKDIKPKYLKLALDERFEYIIPGMKFNESTQKFDFYLDVKREKKLLMDFGGNISSDAINNAFVQLRYDLWGKNIKTLVGNLYFGKFYGSAKLQTRIEFPYQNPFYLSGSLTYNRWDYFKSNTTFFEDKNPSYLIENENFFDFRIGFPVRTKGKLELGTKIANLVDEYYQTNQFSRIDTADKTILNCVTPYILLEMNSLNRKQYANAGTYLSLNIQNVSGREKNKPGSTSLDSTIFKNDHLWYMARLKYQNYFSRIGRNIKLGFYFEGVYSTQKFFNNYVSSTLSSPAFMPFPESRIFYLDEFRAHQYVGGGLQTVVKFSKRFDFRLEGYVFQPYQHIKEDENHKAFYGDYFYNRYFMGSSSMIFHSPLGPISLSLNYYEQKPEPFSISFNLGYIIFNKKALY